MAVISTAQSHIHCAGPRGRSAALLIAVVGILLLPITAYSQVEDVGEVDSDALILLDPDDPALIMNWCHMPPHGNFYDVHPRSGALFPLKGSGRVTERQIHDSLVTVPYIACNTDAAFESYISTDQGRTHANGGSCILFEQKSAVSGYTCLASDALCQRREMIELKCRNTNKVWRRTWTWVLWATEFAFKESNIPLTFPWNVVDGRDPRRTYLVFSADERTVQVCGRNAKLYSDRDSLPLKGCSAARGKEIWVEANPSTSASGTFTVLE